jgi:hypothetical protein
MCGSHPLTIVAHHDALSEMVKRMDSRRLRKRDLGHIGHTWRSQLNNPEFFCMFKMRIGKVFDRSHLLFVDRHRK